MARIEEWNDKWSISKIIKHEKRLIFDLPLQRNGDLWDLEKKSLLIHTILNSYLVPQFHIVDQNELDGVELKKSNLNFINGKQRMTTILSYYKGEFALNEDTPPVKDDDDNEIEVAGKFYDDLSKDLKKEFLSFNLNFTFIKNATYDDLEEIYFRFNSGVVPLSKMELVRTRIGTDGRNFLDEISSMPFFKNSISLTSTMRKRMIDQEIILQIMIYLIDGSYDFSGNSFLQFAPFIKKNGIDEDYKEIIRNTTNYLYQAIPDPQLKEISLKKLHVPAIFITAIQALENGILAEKFGGWMQLFMSHKPQEYTKESGSGTAASTKVEGRISAMKNHYESNIQDSPVYEKPVVKESTGKRGRKPSKPVLEVIVEQKESEVQPESMIQSEPEQQINNTQEESFQQEETVQENLINENTNTSEFLQDAV